MESNCTNKNELVIFRLEKIVEHCTLITSDLENITLEEFSNHDLLARATVFSLQNIGEHITKLRSKFESDYPDIQWQKIADFRILIAHIYWKINFSLIYQIVKKDIPILSDQIKQIIYDIKNNVRS